ncbi:MAG: PT domain-containing protein [Clostridia bacterium]|nr:PT domain-containing protein [Clostridia bacterium]
MKRKTPLLLIVLALALSLTAFVFGCNNNKGGKDAEPTGKPAEITQELVDGAAQMLYEYNKPGEDNSVAATFSLPTKIVDYDGIDLDVEWTLDGGNGLVSLVPADGDKVNVVVDPNADADTPFTVKGTVKGGEFSKDIALNYVIKGFEVATWDYWAANTKDVAMNIRGTVIAKYPYNADNKNTSIFIADADGQHGYFAYRIKCDTQEAYDTDLAIGNVVIVNGKTSIYNGFREMGSGCTYTVLTGSDGKPLTAEVTKIAIDDLFDGRADLASALDPLQAMTVTVSGATIKSIDDSGTKATVTVEKNGTELKIFMNNTYTLTPDEYTEMIGQLAVGYVVDAEGSVAWYNAPQIYPYAGTVKVQSTEVSDADKITNELAAITVPSAVRENTEIALPAAGANYTDVAFTYELKSGAATLADNKLTITVGDSLDTVVLAVKAACGSETAEKEFSVSVIPENLSPAGILEALYALGAGEALPGTYTLTGVVKEVNTAFNPEYNNVTVTIVVDGNEAQTVQCFRLTGTGADLIGAGDTITVTGKLKNYNGTREFDAGCTLDSYTKAGDAQPTEPQPTEQPTAQPTEKPADPTEPPADTPEAILTKLYALKAGEALEGEYTLTGVISAVNTEFSTQHKNVTVTIVVGGDEARPVQCYRLQGNGADTIKKGDTITVKGKLKNFNDIFEFDAGCELVRIDIVSEKEEISYNSTEEIIAALYALKDNETLTGPFTLTGKISTVDTAWNDQFSNITVTIIVTGFEDKPVMCYRLEGDGAKDLKVGDVITVTGNFKNYKGTYEFTQGCKLDSVTAG